MDDTTTPAGQADAGTIEMTRYRGLQRVLDERDKTLAATVAERDALKTQQEADKADREEFEAYRQEKARLAAEQTERDTFEALKAKFEAEEPEPPTPGVNNGVRDGFYRPSYEEKPKGEHSEGFPV